MSKKTLFTRGLLLMVLAVMPTWAKAQSIDVPYLCIEKTNGDVTKVPITETSPKFGHSKQKNSAGKDIRCLMVQYGDNTLYIPCREIKQLTTKFETVANGLGDANADGVIDVADVRVVVSNLLGSADKYNPDPFYRKAADVNKDGKIGIADITGIVDKILKQQNNARAAERLVPRLEQSYDNVVPDPYTGQLMTINLKSGGSLLSELGLYGVTPRYENGEVVWIVDEYGGWPYKIKNVKSVEFTTPEKSLADARKALIALYNATGGDDWANNTNWCSDKPIDEWFGVDVGVYPYVWSLQLNNNSLKGKLPTDGSFLGLGPMASFNFSRNELSGPLPMNDIKRNIQLQGIRVFKSQLTGELPEELFDLPHFKSFEAGENKLTGKIPAGVARLMNEKNMLDISGNDFSGTVPDAIVKHPRFHLMWNDIIPQGGKLTLPTIPGYRIEATDLDGNKFNTSDIYKNNIYTLIFNYSSARGDFTDKLKMAYNTYKSKGFEVLGMAPGDAEQVNSYLHQNAITWLNLDPKSFGDLIGKYYIYNNYINLIDQKGNVVFSSIMDDSGKMEDMWGESTRDQEVFDVLAEKFGQVDFTPYSSTDYSRDGEVMTLQRASVGNGVDIVFIGNCFTDKDMAPGGLYETRMHEAMEQFFAYEPYTSLRNRFNVYAVKAVSKNAEFYENCEQAIESDADAFNYARKVTTLIPNRPLRVNLIYNTYNAGRSFTRSYYNDHSYIAFMLTGVNRVLNHEAGGHGIGRLTDEYVEEAGSTASQELKAIYEQQWSQYGHGANIDIHADVTQTRWARLADDNRYAAEGLGAYEGSGLVQYGIYRPTKNSMMRYNDTPFNAPSREAIYKYVMQESEGPGWTYDYETFVKFDAKGREEFAAALTAASRGAKGERQEAGSEVDKSTLPLPPTIVKGTWQDAMKNPTKIVYRH